MISNYRNCALNLFPKHSGFQRVGSIISIELKKKLSTILFVEMKGSENHFNDAGFTKWLQYITRILLLVRLEEGRNKTFY